MWKHGLRSAEAIKRRREAVEKERTLRLAIKGLSRFLVEK
jgi:hypothetical protein